MSVRSHKREEGAELVKDDIEVISWLAIETGDVCTNKGLPGEAKSEQLAHS